MEDVVIVFVVCMLIGKVFCGMFNDIEVFVLGGYVVCVVFECVGVVLVDVDDVLIGCVV